jgi:hypothetical protein
MKTLEPVKRELTVVLAVPNDFSLSYIEPLYRELIEDPMGPVLLSDPLAGLSLDKLTSLQSKVYATVTAAERLCDLGENILVLALYQDNSWYDIIRSIPILCQNIMVMNITTGTKLEDIMDYVKTVFNDNKG